MRYVTFIVMFMTCSYAAPSDAGGPKEVSKSLEAVRGEFSYDEGKTEAPSQDGQRDAVVVMDPMLVDEAYAYVDRVVTEHAKKSEAGKFNGHDGGTLAKNVGKKVTSELKLKFDPKHKGFDIISFSW